MRNKSANLPEVASGPHQGIDAEIVRCIGISAFVQQEVDALKIAVDCGVHQRTRALGVPGIDVRAMGQQRFHRSEIALANPGKQFISRVLRGGHAAHHQ